MASDGGGDTLEHLLAVLGGGGVSVLFCLGRCLGEAVASFLAQLSDLVVALQRNISAGDNRSELVVLKNRFNGQTGPAGQLAYDSETGRLQTALDFADNSTQPISYDDF